MTARVRRPRQREGVRGEPRDGLLVLTDLHDQAHVLNATARALWELCDGTTTIDEIVDAVCQLSSTPPNIVAGDVGRLFDELMALELVEDVSDRSPVVEGRD